MSLSSNTAAINLLTVNDTAAVAAAVEFDRICGRFEMEMKAGKQPRMETFLGPISKEQTGSLLEALLQIELKLLLRRGQNPVPQDYLERFPEQEVAIRAAFGALAGDAHKRKREVQQLPGRSVGRYRQSGAPEGAEATPMRRLGSDLPGKEADEETVALAKQPTVSNRPSPQTDTLVFSDSRRAVVLGPAGSASLTGSAAGGSEFAEASGAFSTLGEITKCDAGAVAGIEDEAESLPLALLLRNASSPEHRRMLEGLVRYRARLHAAGLVGGFQWLSGYVSTSGPDADGFSGAAPVVTFFRLAGGINQLGLFARESAAFPSDVAERLALRNEYFIDPYFVDLATAPRTLAAEVMYWRSVMKRRSRGKRSMWHIDLAPSAEG